MAQASGPRPDQQSDPKAIPSIDERADPATRPPSVDKLARSLSDSGLPQPLRVEVAREAIASGQVQAASKRASERRRQFLTPVINATGVLLHTNLGRAPLAYSTPGGASNLELSLGSGKRGSRQKAIGDLLATATGAEAAMVVNNCAGAVLLVLAALANTKGTAVSRGELVEIGGGFRVPDVMRQSGSRLVEVGTTNRTRLADFDEAVTKDNVSLIMQIHQSNYRIVGFTEAVPLGDLCGLGVPVVADIGSGLLDAACPWLDGPPPAWLANEPAARQSLEAGASLVLFSGDKLFGGPQAGIIVGKADLVETCARHPLARALRPGSLVLGALQAVTLSYLERRGHEIDFWRMATTPLQQLKDRADQLASQNSNAKVVSTDAIPGGGTLPGVGIPSVGLEIAGDHVEFLRSLDRPIIARVTDHKTTVLDLRTVEPDDDGPLHRAFEQLLTR